MGCQNSLVKNDGSPENEENLPQVPPNSWYAEKFAEETKMSMCPFHFKNKGHVLMSTHLLPSSKSQMDAFPNGEIIVKNHFVLGKDLIYGMGYLHNTALFIEHHWRPRVSFQPEIPNRFERPFYNMLLGVKVIIDGILVPDIAPFDNSLQGCTSTIRSSEATASWLCVPIILCGDTSHHVIQKIHLYRGMMASFLDYANNLPIGIHDVQVEVVYGCKLENNFITKFISLGKFSLEVTENSKVAVEPILKTVKSMLIPPNVKPPTHVPNPNATNCIICKHEKSYTCTTCGASVCGSPQCVWNTVTGYPIGCKSHKTLVFD